MNFRTPAPSIVYEFSVLVWNLKTNEVSRKKIDIRVPKDDSSCSYAVDKLFEELQERSLEICSGWGSLECIGYMTNYL